MSDPVPPSEASAASWRRRLALLLALAAVVAFLDLGGRSLHAMDTTRGAVLARGMLRTGDWLLPRLDGELYANKPPLYVWCVAAVSAVRGGVDAWSARLPSAVGMILLVLAAAGWTRMRTGRDGIALLAGLLVLSTAEVVWHAREARLDMLGAGLCALGTWWWDAAASGTGPRSTPWLAGLALGGALLTKGPPLLVMPVLVLFLGGTTPGLGARLRRSRPAVVLGLAVVMVAAWLVPAWLAGGDAWMHHLVVDQTVDRVSGQGNHLEPWWHYLVVLPAAMAPWGPVFVGLALLALLPRVRRRLGPVGGPLAAAGLMLLAFSFVPTKHVRYILPCVPAFAMGLAWVLDRFAQRPAVAARLREPQGLRVAGILVLVGAAAIAVVVLRSPHAAKAEALVAVGVAALVGLLLVVRAPRVVARGAFLHGVVLAAVMGMLLFVVSRHRLEVRPKVRLQQVVAEAVRPGEPVLVAALARSEDVFEGAPRARRVFTDEGSEPPPAVEHLVVCRRPVIPRVRQWEGTDGELLATPYDLEEWCVLRFPGRPRDG